MLTDTGTLKQICEILQRVPAAIGAVHDAVKKKHLPLRELNRQLQAVKQCGALQIEKLITKFGLENLADRVVKEVAEARALDNSK